MPHLLGDQRRPARRPVFVVLRLVVRGRDVEEDEIYGTGRDKGRPSRPRGCGSRGVYRSRVVGSMPRAGGKVDLEGCLRSCIQSYPVRVVRRRVWSSFSPRPWSVGVRPLLRTSSERTPPTPPVGGAPVEGRVGVDTPCSPSTRVSTLYLPGDTTPVPVDPVDRGLYVLGICPAGVV